MLLYNNNYYATFLTSIDEVISTDVVIDVTQRFIQLVLEFHSAPGQRFCGRTHNIATMQIPEISKQDSWYFYYMCVCNQMGNTFHLHCDIIWYFHRR